MKEVVIEKPTGLALLRQPFPAHQISKLPKPTKKQTETVRNDFRSGIRCQLCGQWHHPEVVHLDYVGHAALTDRLLDCDPQWNWEPVAIAADGSPALDANGGMWIRLTVCNVTRLGYGHADGKKGGDAIKEVIGDALRNAAMRFGAALDLWHKGDLHGDDGNQDPVEDDAGHDDGAPTFNAPAAAQLVKDKIRKCGSFEELHATFKAEAARINEIGEADAALKAQIIALKDQRKAELADGGIGEDQIPY